MPTSRVQQAISAFRAALLEQEAGQMRQMAERWRAVERRLEGSLLALAEEAYRLGLAGRTLTTNQLYEMERYRALLGQAYQESRAYQAWAADLVAERQAEMLKLGIQNGSALIRESFLEAGQVIARFDLLPTEAIENMIGATGEGTPLQELLAASYPETITRLTAELIGNTALGINPRKTARMMADAMAGNLNRALTIARTEQLRVYRQASMAQMRASGLVGGWIWRSALSARTCLSCLAMDGTQHALDDELNDHPLGRCFRQPMIIGLQPIQTTSGAVWFSSLDPVQQREMMGDAKFEAWKEGRFEFGQLARITEDATWGREVRVATLEELGI